MAGGDTIMDASPVDSRVTQETARSECASTSRRRTRSASPGLSSISNTWVDPLFIVPPGAVPTRIRPRRQGEVEYCALAFMGNGLDLAVVPFDDLLADRQPDAIAGVFSAGVQALENDEDVLEVLGGYADTVVCHRENQFRCLFLRRDLNDGRLGAAKFDCVLDEVLKHLLQL